MSIKIYDKSKFFGKTKVVASAQEVSASNLTFSNEPFEYIPVLNNNECLLLADNGPDGSFYGSTVTLATNTGKTYKFGYTFSGADWVVRRDDTTGVSVAVVYMYQGGKPNDLQFFTLSDSTNMRWGTDITIPWTDLLQDDSYYTAATMIKVEGATYP